MHTVVLTHYTTKAGLLGILEHGFAWVPNSRRLTSLLLPMHDFSLREPQQFGMISFTELTPQDGSAHRNRFGSYGIVVSSEWARLQRAQRVIYVERDGPLSRALSNIFDVGYRDLVARIRHPQDAAWRMAFENKHVAGAVVGASLWQNLLTLWEYLEPAESMTQREWRIVNPHPDYSIEGTTNEVISQVSPPEGWSEVTRVLKIRPSDVSALILPRSGESPSEFLPIAYAKVPIIRIA